MLTETLVTFIVFPILGGALAGLLNRYVLNQD